MAANIDMAPTVIGAVNATSDPDIVTDPARPSDGMSLLGGATRPEILGEMSASPWFSIRTPTYQYIETYKKDDPETPQDESLELEWQEYYDLIADGFQLHNLYGTDGKPTADDPPSSPSAATLSARLAAHRACAGRGTETVPGKSSCP
jgi:hypothetical protein